MEDPPCPTTETEVPTASPVMTMVDVEEADDVGMTVDDSTINAPPPRQDDGVTGDLSTGRGPETPLTELHPSIIRECTSLMHTWRRIRFHWHGISSQVQQVKILGMGGIMSIRLHFYERAYIT